VQLLGIVEFTVINGIADDPVSGIDASENLYLLQLDLPALQVNHQVLYILPERYNLFIVPDIGESQALDRPGIAKPEFSVDIGGTPVVAFVDYDIDERQGFPGFGIKYTSGYRKVILGDER